MPRINPTVSKEAKKIYDKWGAGERGHKVSEAIIRHDNKSIDIRLEEIEKRLVKLEGVRK
jgi:hypothetical protein